MSHELVVRGGTVVTAADSVRGDVGVDGGRIAAMAIDATEDDPRARVHGRRVGRGVAA